MAGWTSRALALGTAIHAEPLAPPSPSEATTPGRKALSPVIAATPTLTLTLPPTLPLPLPLPLRRPEGLGINRGFLHCLDCADLTRGLAAGPFGTPDRCAASGGVVPPPRTQATLNVIGEDGKTLLLFAGYAVNIGEVNDDEAEQFLGRI